MKNIVPVLLFIFAAASCVPPTKFKALQSETLTCQEERELLIAENEKLSVANKEMSAKLAKAERDLARAGEDHSMES
jgi:hypothetical protein